MQTTPATPEEAAIAAAFGEVLGTTEVDLTTSFFTLGGDPLDIARVVNRIHGATAAMLIANPSVRELARAVAHAAHDGRGAQLDDEIAELERSLARKRAARAERTMLRRIVPVPRGGPLACTHQQEGLWFLHQLDPSSSVYHVPFALRLRGDLDVAVLRAALHSLVVRHEALRTRFVAEAGLPRQVIDEPPADLDVPVVDLDPGQVEQWAAELAHRSMNLATGPLFRAAIGLLAPYDHALLLVAHHIIADGWSSRILADELARLYTAGTGGAAGAQLPALRVQAADHAAWQRGWLDGAELERQLGYWRETLAHLSTVDFPTDRPRPAQPTGAGATTSRHLPDEVADAARTYARASRRSLLAVLQAGLLTVLHRYTNQQDLPIGSIFSGRTRPEVEPLVGFFANTLVLRTSLSGQPTFAELVQRCHDTVLGATAHQDVPFALVVDALQPERMPGRNPLFQISLSLQPAQAGAGDLALGTVLAEPIEVTDAYSRFDILINASDTVGGGLELSVEYSTELFDGDRIERLLDHFTGALAHGLSTPETPVEEIELLPTAERELVLRAWNDTGVGYPAELPHQMVQAAAANTPDAIALLDHDGTVWTFRQLDTAANQLAHRLRRHGVGPGACAGICLQRGAPLVIALLATWKAGGAYVPLDPELPAERLTLIHADAAPVIVVTDTDHVSMFDPALALDAEWSALAAEPTTAPDSATTLDSIAYVLYTSGSTGAPKGVLIPQRAAHRQIIWMQDSYQLRSDDRVLQKTPYSFDVSVWEFFWPLTVGATLVLAKPGGHRDPEYLHRLIASRGITTMHFVPTMLKAFLDAATHLASPGAPTTLRRVFCSGEALPAETAARFLAMWPTVEMHNLYGPTEAFDVTAWRYEPGTTAIPIGHPIANTRAYVLDGRLRPVPVGVTGQLLVAGAGLAHGYLNKPALTAERFLPDPYADQPGRRMYATGDLARWRPDGLLEYLGRIDRQVKLRGQRVELGEIEHVLARHPRVRQCAVLLRDNACLAAYVVGEAGLDVNELREYLADWLPTYMIPTALVPLAELPVTPNGKLDVARLPDTAPPTTEHIAPRTSTERWLAQTWQDLLGTDKVGAGDNFFDLGGNSLHATQLIARIQDSLDVSLAARDLFTNPGLEQLAARLDEAGAAPDRIIPPRKERQ